MSTVKQGKKKPTPAQTITLAEFMEELMFSKSERRIADLERAVIAAADAWYHAELIDEIDAAADLTEAVEALRAARGGAGGEKR